MAIKNPYFFLILLITFCLLPFSSLSQPLYRRPRSGGTGKKQPKILIKPKNQRPPPRFQPIQRTLPSYPSLTYSEFVFPQTTPSYALATPGGEWVLLQKSIGVSAMHMQLLHNNKVVIFDRTDFGPSNLSLPVNYTCRENDEKIKPDCTAHSVLYDVDSNTFRPLYVQTDVWCSSGAVTPDGTLVQTGGFHAGDHKIRLFTPCNDDNCDWVELPQNLTVQRWYASNHILPNGNVIIVGGRKSFSYEFFPKNGNGSFSDVNYFPFLKETTDFNEENNLYPFLHIMPDGNLFIFANQRSILLDYVNNHVIREFPAIPGEKRSYPSTGSSVLLPIVLTGGDYPEVEVMICGGAMAGAFPKAAVGIHVAASKTCGRMRLTDSEPQWEMEEMPMGRVMSDMLLLPTGHVIIVNGAAKGTAGWEYGEDPVLNPVLYNPTERVFSVLNPTTIPRMYHSSGILLPDGKILVGGSNPHVFYNFTGVKYPTDLSLEAFSPPYLDPQYAHLRPSILSIEDGPEAAISYGQKFSITFTLTLTSEDRGLSVTMVAPSFTTHSFAMNQRLLVLEIVEVNRLSLLGYKVTVCAPPTRNVAPPGYYMLFVVHNGVPGQSVWVKLK